MRKHGSVGRLQALSRVAALGLVGGLAAGCSSDAMRFNGNPFANPFASQGSEPGLTGSLPGAASTGKQSQPLATPQVAARTPANTSIHVQPAAVVQPSGSGQGGWTARGGTPITVAANDTLNGMATRYGVPASAILSANGLASAAEVKPGRRITIPVYSAGGAPASASRTVLAAVPATTVKRTIEKVPEPPKQPLRPTEVARADASKSELKPEAKPEPQRSAEQKVAKAEVQPVPQPKSAAQPAAAAKQEAAAREPEQTASLNQPGYGDFRWPARGRVISGFDGSGGNEGINIAVPEGTPVKAAEAGTVAYAGSEVKGYGNLVLIRHDNGFVSAYAHNGELAVKRGEKVKRGQVIAKSGQTGNVTSPQLHFEIRKGSTPVDPMPHLGAN